MKRLYSEPIKLFQTILLIIIIIGIILFFILNYDLFLKSPEEVVAYVHNLGFWGPVILFLLIILEVIIAPIPGSVIAIATGYAYGFVGGTAICYLANVTGTLLAFYIARHFGRIVVEKFVNIEKLKVYDEFMTQEGKFIMIFAYVIPVIPPDIISFIAGLSKMRFKVFFMFVAIGYLPYMLLLNYFGETLYTSGWNSKTILMGAILFIITLTGLIIYFILKRKNIPKK